MSQLGLEKLHVFRVTDSQHQAIQSAAEAAGLSVSAWIRLVTVTATGDTTLLEQLKRSHK